MWGGLRLRGALTLSSKARYCSTYGDLRRLEKQVALLLLVIIVIIANIVN